MKSKRAEEILRKYTERIEGFYDDGDYELMIWPLSAGRAVELAEEDMAEKAAKAFCFCKCGVGPCIMKQVGRDECKDLRDFKQKLME